MKEPISSTLIVLAHPEPSSFNAHWAHTTAESFMEQDIPVLWSNLYADNFDPVERESHFKTRINSQKFDVQREQRAAYESGNLPFDVAKEIEKLSKANLVVFHFPLWWFSMPAILKGWMDRVFVYGGMYNSRQRHDRGVCSGKRALFCVTTGASAKACSHKGNEGNIQYILWPMMYPLRYLGFIVLQPFIIHGVHDGRKGEEREAYRNQLDTRLKEYRSLMHTINDIPTIPYNTDGDFDENGCLKSIAPEYSPFIKHVS